MYKVLIINGPNLNTIGKREPLIYGELNLDQYIEQLQNKYKHKLNISTFQSNVEGYIIDKLQEVDAQYQGVIINAGAYTHTSIAIRDALAAVNIPVVEVHISNILDREEFRNSSLLSVNCAGSIIGFGIEGYDLALKYFLKD